MIKRAILRLFRLFGYVPVRVDVASIEPPPPRDVPSDFTDADEVSYRAVEPYTMSSPERVYALIASTRHIVETGVPGAFVECGVWKGGSMMAVAHTLVDLGVGDRDLYLFDTFSGMTEPSDEDKLHETGSSAADVLATQDRDSRLWAVSPLDEVKANMERTGYDTAHVHFVEGPVEETVPAEAPEQIALLRLDTDWYRSTKHELVHLYPRLSPGGILIVDDYGHWSGARQAVDEYLADQRLAVLLHRIDTAGRIVQKARL
jgi:O-methyltransferase